MITLENRYVRELIKIANANVGHIEKEDWIDYQVQDFEKVAKEFGYIKLGSGYFSQAWTHPEIKNYAIKLGFKKEDSGAAYAAYCRANQGKAGIPVIHGIERTRACYVVLMDKLISFELVQKALPLYDPIYDTPRVVREYGVLKDLFECGLEECYYDGIDFDNLSELEKTAIGIYEHFHGIAYFDMHEGNVMLDKFGRLVITDPVSFGKTCKKDLSTAVRNVFVVDELANINFDAAWKDFNEHFKARVVTFPNWTIDINWKSFNWLLPAKVAANPNYKPSFTEKELSFAERFGAHGCKKPLFLVQKDIRNGIKHK